MRTLPGEEGIGKTPLQRFGYMNLADYNTTNILDDAISMQSVETRLSGNEEALKFAREKFTHST